jgi:ABC-2 type transport system ATP-binding protein
MNFEKAMTYIGGIVENPDLYGYMSGWDNLKLYARIRKVGNERIEEVVKLVGLEKRIKEKVSKYSLGMKQRLGLALTLLHKPKVLILDEPTNGLDPAGIKDLRKILKDLAEKEKTAVFISSHLLSEMELMCDKVAVIENGKIIKIQSLKDNEEKSKEHISDYVLEINNTKKAIDVLKENHFDVQEVKDKENIILLNEVDKEKIPFAIKMLVMQDINIYTVTEKTKSLEDVFFGITKGGDGNE